MPKAKLNSQAPSRTAIRSPRRRVQEPGSPRRLAGQQPLRRSDWAGKTPDEVLKLYPIGKTPPTEVLDVLIDLFNTQHTALQKTVSHKTRQERAQFLRRFFRDLQTKAGFKKLPDPRNLGQKHIRAMVQVWRQEHLASATVQTYLSFLRGLAFWLGKHGFVRDPAYYGLTPEEYQRHEIAQRDKSWSAQGIDADALIAEVCAADPYVGASLRLIRVFGLRRKESVQFRPFESVVAFEETGLPQEAREADRYVRIKGKGGRVRFLPLDSPERVAAVVHAQGVVSSRDAHLGHPAHDLKYNLRRFDYLLQRFGITYKALGVTAHGLRHQVLNDLFEGGAGAILST